MNPEVKLLWGNSEKGSKIPNLFPVWFSRLGNLTTPQAFFNQGCVFREPVEKRVSKTFGENLVECYPIATLISPGISKTCLSLNWFASLPYKKVTPPWVKSQIQAFWNFWICLESWKLGNPTKVNPPNAPAFQEQ